MAASEHRIFRREYSTKTCFDEVDFRQNDTSTKSLFRRNGSVDEVLFDEVLYIPKIDGNVK